MPLGKLSIGGAGEMIHSCQGAALLRIDERERKA